jgi:hypothetical protein
MWNIFLSTLKKPLEEDEVGGGGAMPKCVDRAADEAGMSLEMIGTVGA